MGAISSQRLRPFFTYFGGKWRAAPKYPAPRYGTKMLEGNYDVAPDLTATWFIDPPYYNRSGALYPYGNKTIGYDTLGDWCQARSGQTMVCEAEGAVWLPFKPFQVIRALSGVNGKTYSREAIWCRDDSPEDA